MNKKNKISIDYFTNLNVDITKICNNYLSTYFQKLQTIHINQLLLAVKRKLIIFDILYQKML